MSISGITTTCKILTNTQFVLSGLSQTNISTINITDVNGLDVSECFGITSKIVNVNGDNVTLTGDCNTSLEIVITEGITTEVECLYTGFTQQQDGIVLFNFADGTTSDNIHPDCCTALGYNPEIGSKFYYVCRSIPEVCVECCSAYTATNIFDENDYMIFDFVTGGTVTTVPNAQCCYDNGFVDTLVGGKIKCIDYVEPDPCEGLEIVEPVPQFGDITFVNPSTGVQTVLVPTAECCTSLGYSYEISGTKFKCFNSIAPPPTVTLTNDSCCLEAVAPTPTPAPTPTLKSIRMSKWGERESLKHVVCAYNEYTTRYFLGLGTTPAIGDTFYTNSSGTIIFKGNNDLWKVGAILGKIDNNGKLISNAYC